MFAYSISLFVVYWPIISQIRVYVNVYFHSRANLMVLSFRVARTKHLVLSHVLARTVPYGTLHTLARTIYLVLT